VDPLSSLSRLRMALGRLELDLEEHDREEHAARRSFAGPARDGRPR
jgi:hypothetical protein